MWQYIVLDFDNRKDRPHRGPSPSLYGYNNMAHRYVRGAVTATSSTAPPATKSFSACRTASSSCPRMPYRKVDLDKTSRRVLSAAEFQAAGGAGTPASWLHTATLDNLHPRLLFSFRINGLTGNAADYKLFALGTDGRYHEVVRLALRRCPGPSQREEGLHHLSHRTRRRQLRPLRPTPRKSPFPSFWPAESDKAGGLPP